MKHKSLLLTLAAAAMLLLATCTPKPSNPVESNELPPMYPDYTDVWIPYNIAPLNFLLRGDYEAVEVKATCGGETLTVNRRGPEAVFDLAEELHCETASVYRIRSRAISKLVRLRYGARE